MRHSFEDRITECYLSKISKLTLEEKHCELLEKGAGGNSKESERNKIQDFMKQLKNGL